MEKWKVFYYNEKELCAYTLKGSLRAKNRPRRNIPMEEIKVVVEER